MSIRTVLLARLSAVALFVAAVFTVSTQAHAGVIYKLNASNVSFTIPSPLFTSNSVSGFLEISSGVVAGGSFGGSQLENLSFDVAGYKYTLADFLPGFDVDGRISADGNSIPFLQIGYDLSTSLTGCAGGCYGSINVAQGSPSNLLAVGDVDFDQYGLVEFDTAFTRAASVPEPLTLSLFGAGLAASAAMRRRSKKKAA